MAIDESVQFISEELSKVIPHEADSNGRKNYTILLSEGTDCDAFCEDLNSQGFECVANPSSFHRVCAFKFTEEEANTISERDDVESLDYQRDTVLHSYNPQNRNGKTTVETYFSTSYPSSTFDGTDFIPAKFFWDTNTTAPTPSNRPLGFFNNAQFGGGTQEDTFASTNTTISHNFDGSTVDIVIVEPSSGSVETPAWAQAHPDFKDSSNNFRFVAVDWSDYDSGVTNVRNNQVTNGWTDLGKHALACASVAAGTYCGWAKNANLYYADTTYDSYLSIYSAIYAWHQAKPVNPATGKRNATIVNNSWGWYADYRAENIIPIEEISSFNAFDDDGNQTTVTRPGGGWGSDYSDFVDNGFNVVNTTGANGTDKWGIATFRSNTSRNSTWDFILDYFNSIEGCYQFFSAGNTPVVFARTDQPQYNNQIFLDANYFYYDLNEYNNNKVTATENTYAPVTGTEYTHRCQYLGHRYSFYVSTYQFSTTNPLMEHYPARGPAIDALGQGRGSWCAASNYNLKTDSNGFQWGTFSGTSAGCPNVVGAVALMLDHYYYGEGGASWPTIAELRTMIRSTFSQHPLQLVEDLGKDRDGNAVSKTAFPAAGTEMWNHRLQGFYLQNQTMTQRTQVTERVQDRNTYNDNYVLTVGNSGSTSYTFTGTAGPNTFSASADPVIVIRKGDTLTFNISASGHPLYIKQYNGSVVSGSSGGYSNGVTNNGTDSGFIVWNTDTADAGTYYYICSNHSSMANYIIVLGEDEQYYQGTGIMGTTPNTRVWLPWSIRNGTVGKTRQPRSITYTSRPSTGQTYPRRKIRVA